MPLHQVLDQKIGQNINYVGESGAGRMDLGYWAAKAYHVLVDHRATRIDHRFEETAKWKDRYPDDENMHNPKNLDIIELIMSKWDENWFFKSGRTPRGISEIE